MLGDVEEAGFTGTRMGFQVLKVVRSSSSSSRTNQLHMWILYVYGSSIILVSSEVS